MLRVALTGGIACGKSLVGSIIAGRGLPVCDADDLAHALMAGESGLREEIAQAFGEAVLAADGGVDRVALGQRVFRDDRARGRLNAIVHPAVESAWEAWLRERERDSRAAVVIIPLLYEIGADRGWDAVVCVTASEAVRLQRLAARHLSEAEARLRMAAQMPTRAKVERADYVIVNDGTREIVEEQTARVVNSILEK